MVFEHRQKLESLYQTELAPAKKREKKASIFTDLRDDFRNLKSKHAELAAYEDWINRPLNNAKISGVAAYHDLVPAFSNLLAEKEGDLVQFYEACRQLADKNIDDRRRIMEQLMQKDPKMARTQF